MSLTRAPIVPTQFPPSQDSLPQSFGLLGMEELLLSDQGIEAIDILRTLLHQKRFDDHREYGHATLRTGCRLRFRVSPVTGKLQVARPCEQKTLTDALQEVKRVQKVALPPPAALEHFVWETRQHYLEELHAQRVIDPNAGLNDTVGNSVSLSPLY